MWIFTETGFVSAVQHYSDPETVVVRARDAQSLAMLAEQTDVPIERSPTSDYPYRVHIKRRQLSDWMVKSAASMDYTNFKDRVHETRGDEFAGALLGVWDVMHNVEDDNARSR